MPGRDRKRERDNVVGRSEFDRLQKGHDQLVAQVERVAAVAARAACDAGESRADLQLVFFLQGRTRAKVLETLAAYNSERPGILDGIREKGPPLKRRIYEDLLAATLEEGATHGRSGLLSRTSRPVRGVNISGDFRSCISCLLHRFILDGCCTLQQRRLLSQLFILTAKFFHNLSFQSPLYVLPNDVLFEEVGAPGHGVGPCPASFLAALDSLIMVKSTQHRSRHRRRRCSIGQPGVTFTSPFATHIPPFRD